ncbi:MAG TPA: phosphate acyltransferase PlsX [Candidatus Omnitrophica bacterium]|nr:MAG: phosphate acyltransferase PlsX [Candidatus Omnitrophota bacterium]RKY34819.1 MAG: phosphate acyltransferase PlsX [Candidatus Omnitrophota bacterium]RKY43851.1 MAG: phosphate acyltransferase PlsX [Candidatus Omnitrophota bacterium]HEC70080.1 phosphate acyltransferase PlsX [Candidatus Omnitrophota bacterium]
MKVALDVMGGDYAPLEILKGACLASQEFKDLELILVGKSSAIKEYLEKENLKFKFSLIEAAENIEMADSPALSVRRKKGSSIVKGVELIKNKEADAFVSCGNTGALVCASTLYLGLIEGIERPGIGLVFPTLEGSSLMIDVGANIDPKPLHLFQYALMAQVYSQKVLNKPNPSLGLLNIGEEETKGPEFLRETSSLLKKNFSNFLGNIEPKDIFIGICDCIISDGLAGNIALKVSEGFAEAVAKFLISEVKKDFLGSLGLGLLKRSLKRFSQMIDYAEYGGAPLLGIDGVVIIGHGRSNAKAVKNAIRAALKELEVNINEEIKTRIKN